MKNRRLISMFLGFAFVLLLAERVSAFRSERSQRYGSELFREPGAFGAASALNNLEEGSFTLLTLPLPPATSADYGLGGWQAGPAPAGIYLGDDWLFGVISQHRWSLTTEGSRFGVIQTTAVEYFFEYNISDRTKIGLTHTILLNWNAESAHYQAFPIDLDKARTLSVGKLPLKFTVDGFFEVTARWRF